MAKLIAAEVVTPSALDAAARQRFASELYALHARIFRGVDEAAFVRYVVGSTAQHTWIQLYRDPAGDLGGYFAVHIYEREIDGVMTAVVRGETGILRRHRGNNMIGSFIIGRALRYVMSHPTRPTYFLGSLVHPSTYSLFGRFVEEVWPREGVETPPEILGLMDTLGDAFGLDRVDPSNGLVRKVGWQTIDSSSDRAYWHNNDRPGVQFFLRENPGYAEGHGLLTVAPVTVRNALGAFARWSAGKAASRARKATAGARAGLAALLPAGRTAPMLPQLHR